MGRDEGDEEEIDEELDEEFEEAERNQRFLLLSLAAVVLVLVGLLVLLLTRGGPSDSQAFERALASASSNAVPTIVHNPPPQAVMGGTLPVDVALEDAVGLYEVSCFYRPAGGGAWQRVRLDGDDHRYSGVLQITDRMFNGVEYYFEVRSRGGGHWTRGTPQAPIQVKVR